MAKATYLKRGQTATTGELFLAYWDKMYPTTLDQYFRKYPIHAWLEERKDTTMAAGAEQIIVRAEISENPNGGALDWEEPVSMEDFDPKEALTYHWKVVGYGVRNSLYYQRLAGRNNPNFNPYEEKRQNTLKTIRKLMSSLVHTGSGGTSKEIDGLSRLIPATAKGSQSVSVGNKNPSSFAWWRSQARSMSGRSAASDLEKYLLYLTDDIRQEGGEVDVNFTDITTRQIYEMNQLDFQTSMDFKIADNNFELCQYKRKPIIDDADAAAGQWRMVDNRAIKYCVDPQYELVWTGEKPIPNVMFTTVDQIALICNLVRLSARWVGCLYNITE